MTSLADPAADGGDELVGHGGIGRHGRDRRRRAASVPPAEVGAAPPARMARVVGVQGAAAACRGARRPVDRGDRRPHDRAWSRRTRSPPRSATRRSRPRSGPAVRWIATPDLEAHGVGLLQGAAGVWGAPGSPFLSLDGALDGIRWAREQRLPFLGTCGGLPARRARVRPQRARQSRRGARRVRRRAASRPSRPSRRRRDPRAALLAGGRGHGGRGRRSRAAPVSTDRAGRRALLLPLRARPQWREPLEAPACSSPASTSGTATCGSCGSSTTRSTCSRSSFPRRRRPPITPTR